MSFSLETMRGSFMASHGCQNCGLWRCDLIIINMVYLFFFAIALMFELTAFDIHVHISLRINSPLISVNSTFSCAWSCLSSFSCCRLGILCNIPFPNISMLTIHLSRLAHSIFLVKAQMPKLQMGVDVLATSLNVMYKKSFWNFRLHLQVVQCSSNVTLTGSAAIQIMTQRPVFWLEMQNWTGKEE